MQSVRGDPRHARAWSTSSPLRSAISSFRHPAPSSCRHVRCRWSAGFATPPPTRPPFPRRMPIFQSGDFPIAASALWGPCSADMRKEAMVERSVLTQGDRRCEANKRIDDHRTPLMRAARSAPSIPASRGSNCSTASGCPTRHGERIALSRGAAGRPRHRRPPAAYPFGAAPSEGAAKIGPQSSCPDPHLARQSINPELRIAPSVCDRRGTSAVV